MKIYVDAACDIHYSSFYIEGLMQCFGKKRIYFKNKPFRKFKFNNHFLAFIIKEEQNETKFIIDYADSSRIDKNAPDWCDHYLKINIDENVNYSTDKLISIGPSFGIHIFSSVKTYFLAPLNYLKSRKRIEHPKSFFSCFNL